MPILKTVTAPNGAVLSLHKLTTSTTDYRQGMTTLSVLSWTTLERHDLGDVPAWQWQCSLQSELVGTNTPDELLLLTEQFAGGSVVPDATGTLAAEAAKRWALIKQWRINAVNEDLVTPYGVFQCGDEDRANITDAVLLAQALTAAGQPVAITWTLKDNSIVTLDATQMTTVGLLLGQQVQTAHATARERRAAVDAATTVEEVLAVQWAAPVEPPVEPEPPQV